MRKALTVICSNDRFERMISLETAIDSLQYSLKSNTSWFTGIAVKHLWSKSILALSLQKSSKIQTGQWSAYAHLSASLALITLIKRCCNPGDYIVTDPFLVSLFPEIFEEYKTEIYDVNRNTLAPNIPPKKSDLLIIYSQTGATKHLETILQNNSEQKVLLVINSTFITHNIAQLCNSIQNGGVVFISTHNPLQKQIETFTNVQLPYTPFTLSFFLEDKISMSLEYHLSESVEVTKSNLDSLYSILSSLQTNSFKTLFKKQFQKTLYGVGKNAIKPKELNIKEVWSNITLSPLPDPLIHLLLADERSNTFFSTNESTASERLNFLYSHLLNSLPRVAEGSLMIPHIDTSEIYTRLLFFTTEPIKWKNEIKALGYSEPHNFIATKTRLPNTRFIEKYGLLVDLI